MLIYLAIKNKRDKNFKRWKYIADSLIQKAIFFEADEYDLLQKPQIQLANRVKKLNKNPHFRKLLVSEILSAKQNMSGNSANNLKSLYQQLGLDSYALNMLKSKYWYVKASGLQQIGVMALDKYFNQVLAYIDHERALIRIEAQNTIIKLKGFDGLKFLDTISYQITEWQQIKLLDELALLPTENFLGINIWLKSTNDSVVIFALKLAKNYNRFELYQEVLICLKHNNPEVRRQAIYALKELPTGDTSSHLIEVYDNETDRNKLAIIEVLAEVSMGAEIPFLINLLCKTTSEFKMAIVKTIAKISDAALADLQLSAIAKEYPLNEIIIQVVAEKE